MSWGIGKNKFIEECFALIRCIFVKSLRTNLEIVWNLYDQDLSEGKSDPDLNQYKMAWTIGHANQVGALKSEG